MFCCINLNEKYRDYYRLLGNDEENAEPAVYRFKRVTMGTTDSPFLSINTVHYHLDKVAKETPSLRMICQYIKDHLYVDDVMAAVNSEEEAMKLRQTVSKLLLKMKMKIQTWSSN